MSDGQKKAAARNNAPSKRLTLPLVLEEGRAPNISKALLMICSGFITACVIWASVTQIRELTIAPGQVKPSGSIQLVQHLEGGLVADIVVSEGEIVEKGAPLIRLQPIAAQSDLGQVKVRVANLAIQKERLSALIDDRKPDFSKWQKDYAHLVSEQVTALEAIRNQREAERQTLVSRVETRDGEVASYVEQLENINNQARIQAEQLKIKQGLMAEGLTSKAVFLESKRLHERALGESLSLKGQLKTAQEALNEARIQLLELDTEYREKMTEERTRVSGEYSELAESLGKHEDRVARLLVRAPITGIVQELVPKAVGEVIKPGGLVAQVVPMDHELIAEVHIQPKDIGHVKVGDPAEVKVTTYDPARFGGIDGEVRKISASTFRTEKGEPYYKAVIGLSRKYVGLKQEAHQVLPGMVVNAEIVTGAKSLTRYLLKPVYRSLDSAFTER